MLRVQFSENSGITVQNKRKQFSQKEAACDLMNKNDTCFRVSLQLNRGTSRSLTVLPLTETCIAQSKQDFFQDEKFYRFIHVDSPHVSVLGNHEK